MLVDKTVLSESHKHTDFGSYKDKNTQSNTSSIMWGLYSHLTDPLPFGWLWPLRTGI